MNAQREQLILKIPRTQLESHLSDLTRRPIPKPIDSIQLQHNHTHNHNY